MFFLPLFLLALPRISIRLVLVRNGYSTYPISWRCGGYYGKNFG